MANEAQATYWNESAGPVWLSREEDLDVASRPFGLAAMDAASVQAGERVLDVGCGTGSTTIELGRRVGEAGEVLGLDISSLLLGRAREKAKAAGAANVDFVEADAQTHKLPGSYDLIFSRFGVMFFDEPVAAFTNLRATTAPEGRLAFACWQDVFSNAWMSVPAMAASSVLGAFDAPPPDAPGPFFYADADRARSVLGDAGYRQVHIDPFQTTMDTAVADVNEWLGFIVRMGPLGGRFQESDADTQQRTLDAVLEAAAPFESGGAYRLPAAGWIVTARA
jgi:SAM-dependent methyltransferase